MENQSKTNTEQGNEKTFVVVSFDGFEQFNDRKNQFRNPSVLNTRSNVNKEPFEFYVLKATDKPSAYLDMVMTDKFFCLSLFISLWVEYGSSGKFFGSIVPLNVQEKIKKEYAALKFSNENPMYNVKNELKMKANMDLSWITKDVAQKMWLFFNDPIGTPHDKDDGFQASNPYHQKHVAQLIEWESIVEKK